MNYAVSETPLSQDFGYILSPKTLKFMKKCCQFIDWENWTHVKILLNLLHLKRRISARYENKRFLSWCFYHDRVLLLCWVKNRDLLDFYSKRLVFLSVPVTWCTISGMMGSTINYTKERTWNWRQIDRNIPEKKNFLKMKWNIQTVEQLQKTKMIRTSQG